MCVGCRQEAAWLRAGEQQALDELRERSERGRLTTRAVRGFAAEQGVAPGIVVTRMQHPGWSVPRQLELLKRPLGWAEPGSYAEV